ncbi:MAG: hypothetical protein ABJC63_15925, partial [Gemmatimonadales bacterium]
MLTQYEIELIHGEVDGENTAEASAEVRKLVETQPEALALMKSVQSLDALFSQVPDRAPPDRVRQLIHNAMPLNSRASPMDPEETTQTVTEWAVQQWNGLTNLMGELMLTKKVLLGATTAVAAIALIGYAMNGYQPSIFDSGTIGSGGDMSGVQQAGRYHGVKKTEADVTLSSPEIQTLLQDDKVLALVKTKGFQQLMSNASYQQLMANASYQQLMANPSYQQLMASPSYQQLMASPSYQQLMAS